MLIDKVFLLFPFLIGLRRALPGNDQRMLFFGHQRYLFDWYRPGVPYRAIKGNEMTRLALGNGNNRLGQWSQLGTPSSIRHRIKLIKEKKRFVNYTTAVGSIFILFFTRFFFVFATITTWRWKVTSFLLVFSFFFASQNGTEWFLKSLKVFLFSFFFFGEGEGVSYLHKVITEENSARTPIRLSRSWKKNCGRKQEGIFG